MTGPTPKVFNQQPENIDFSEHWLRSWFVVVIASLFFFYEFIQMNMFDTISQKMIIAFSLDAAQLGILSSMYFIANVIFLFVAGMLLDRCATRKVILSSLGVCILGTFMFAYAHNFALAAVSRFFTGIGSAFCFISVIRLSSRWFPARKMALVTGVVVTIAMLGGMTSQTPLTFLINNVGWRHALIYDAALGVMIFILIALFVRDYPSSHHQTHLNEQRMIGEIGYWRSMRMAFLRMQNWLGGIYVSMMNLPINVLGGLWGILYVTTTYGFSKMAAADLTMMLFLGAIIGCPLAGWISDRSGYRKPTMIVGGVLSLSLIFMIMYIPHLSYAACFTLFLLLGICSSTQVIGYPLVAESSRRVVTAMSVSVVNISVVAGIGFIQSLFGYVMDIQVWHRLHHMTSHYLASDFHWAMWLFPIGYIIALLAACTVKETRCHQRAD